jgi:plastocyanin
MKSSMIVGAIVVVIVLLGGWLLLRSGNSGQQVLTPTVLPTQTIEATPSPATSSVTVSITDAGFVPANITVKPGTTVTFVNNGQQAHWVASNPHPTHTDLPGFDAKHAMAPGESYVFVFEKIGTWGYHDHLNPSTMGAVVVQL